MPTRQARLGQRAAAQADVAAGVDGVVRARPRSSSSAAARSTDQPLTSPDGSIEPGATASRVEVAVGLVAELLAAREHLAHVRVRLARARARRG